MMWCAVACVRACVCWSAVDASRHLVMGSLLCRPTWKLDRFGRGCIATCRARGQDIGFARARTKFHVNCLALSAGGAIARSCSMIALLLVNSHLTLACPSPLELSRVAHVHMRPNIFAAFSYGRTRVYVVV
jgi:hypothetical protein